MLDIESEQGGGRLNTRAGGHTERHQIIPNDKHQRRLAHTTMRNKFSARLPTIVDNYSPPYKYNIPGSASHRECVLQCKV